VRISHSWEMPYSEIRANLRKAAVLQLKLQDVLQLLGRSRRGWILAWQWRRPAKGKRARTGDSGGNDVSGDLAVHIASSREEAMAVQGVDASSASVPSSVVRSAAAGASAAAAPLA
jgi:hypothetical protein